MYDINADIASFLRKLKQNVAQLRDFPIHTVNETGYTETCAVAIS
jgi:hypothetical protein